MTSQHDQTSLVTVKLCTDKAAYEARMLRKTLINMDDVKQAIWASGKYEILVFTPHLIILKSGNAEATLSKDGRIIIKRVLDKTEATKIAQEIFRAVLETR